MAGHSKWANIKHRKGAADAKKSKVFAKHAKLIQIAAKAGPEPEKNAALALAIENAKAENVPNDNIDRAIKKGSGTGKDAANYESTRYEGYLPGGVAVIIEALTDNKNRTVSNVRTILSKNGGNIGDQGTVSWMFQYGGIIEIQVDENTDIDEKELEIIELGADDYQYSPDTQQFTIYTKKENFIEIRKTLQETNTITHASLAWIANQKTTIEDTQKAEKILKIIDLLEDDDDISDVYTNAEYSSDMS